MSLTARRSFTFLCSIRHLRAFLVKRLSGQNPTTATSCLHIKKKRKKKNVLVTLVDHVSECSVNNNVILNIGFSIS